MNISDDQKNGMLALVRLHLAHKLLNMPEAIIPDDPLYDSECGLFVTLHKHKNLRGCIGHIIGREPLRKSLLEVAESSAFQDPRFPALSDNELDMIDIEISLLTPMEAIEKWQDIHIGIHGILIQSGYRQAVYLPQVAPEQGWDLETTLGNLCLKAGLPYDAYLDDTMQFNVFTATVFSE